MTDDPLIDVVFDIDLRRPACVILQAAKGGDREVVSRLFNSECWLIAPTSGMKLYRQPLSHWVRVADVCNKEAQHRPHRR